MNDNANHPRKTDQDYMSYMMRMLRTQSGETQVWRVSLGEPLTEQLHRLDDLRALPVCLPVGAHRARGAGRQLMGPFYEYSYHRQTKRGENMKEQHRAILVVTIIGAALAALLLGPNPTLLQRTAK
jgi:hypothetical protein